jgi:hypothetical protein
VFHETLCRFSPQLLLSLTKIQAIMLHEVLGRYLNIPLQWDRHGSDGRAT